MTPDPRTPDPTIHRRRLRNELRRVREAAGKTQDATRLAMDWSLSKLIRIESGAVGISTNDLKALLRFYGVPTDQTETFIELAKAAREPTPWRIWRDVATTEFIAFLGYESSAAIIRNFEPLLVPGLLQTEDYARTVLTAFQPGLATDKIDAQVDLRIQRQEVLSRPEPPKVNFILDEGVIRRSVGDTTVMRRQLKQLLDLSEQAHIAIRVMPFSTGLYPRLRSPYVHFEFAEDEDEDVLYVENATGEFIIRESAPDDRGPSAPVQYLQSFWQLETVALQPAARDLLAGALREVGGPTIIDLAATGATALDVREPAGDPGQEPGA